ncbi:MULTISPECIES: hypothetical protein [unclassified Picosynechococcus]|nr:MULTISPECIES: hypothetical protein [unclassified Picosynechococcus]QCS48061.1 hypothetical protein FEK30_00610 [Picosynechococcus sp. PCC 11901]
MTEKFWEVAERKLSDLDKKEKMASVNYCIRVPQDIADVLTREDGTKNTPLMRRILVKVIREHPDLLEEIKQELGDV